MAWEMLLPLAEKALSGGSGTGGGGLLGGLLGGGGTEVKQAVSSSSNSAVGLSITNILGGGKGDAGSISLPNSQSPTQTQSTVPQSGYSQAPVYGQTFGATYEPGNLDIDPENPKSGLTLAGFNPLLVGGVVVAIGALFFIAKEA